MVDTHTHLGICKPPTAELVARARDAGVNRLLTVGIGDEQNDVAVADAEAYGEVFACVGRHPNGADGFGPEAIAAIEAACEHDRVVAVGETGLDWFRMGAQPEVQRAAFSAQVGVARNAGLPVVIHLRDKQGSDAVYEEAFATLADEAGGTDVILHCFSAGPEWAARAAEQGWYCSFAGNSTYPKAEELREAARLVPEDRILVETDAPFLSPQPVRGKANEPANVIATAERIAQVREAERDAFFATVERNAARVFGW